MPTAATRGNRRRGRPAGRGSSKGGYSGSRPGEGNTRRWRRGRAKGGGDHLAMGAVGRKSGIPIMADESVFTPMDALDVIRHEAADVLSLYPGKHGGIRQTQQIAKLAEAAGVVCTIGSNLEREVATAAMAHVTVCTPNLNCERLPRGLIRPLHFTEALTAPPPRYDPDTP